MRFSPSNLLLTSSIGLALASPLSHPTAKSFTLILSLPPGTTLPAPLAALSEGTWAVTASLPPSQHAVLTSTSTTTPRISYEYGPDGTTSVGSATIGLIMTPGGSATVPSNNIVGLENNNGTKGVGIRRGTGGVPVLSYAGGGFMACKAGEEVVPRFRASGQRVLEGCVGVEVRAECSVDGPGQQLGMPREVECV